MAINNINDAWQGKSGKEVREVIQRTFGEKVASTYFDPIEMKLYGFKSIDDRDAYIATGDSSLIIDTCPFSFTGTQNRINILDKQGTTTLYFTTNANEANITVGFESQEKGITDTEWKEIAEDFVVSVSVDRGASGNYETFIADKQVLNGNTLTFDVRRYLATGSNRIKVTAKGVDSGAVANLTFK